MLDRDYGLLASSTRFSRASWALLIFDDPKRSSVRAAIDGFPFDPSPYPQEYPTISPTINANVNRFMATYVMRVVRDASG